MYWLQVADYFQPSSLNPESSSIFRTASNPDHSISIWRGGISFYVHWIPICARHSSDSVQRISVRVQNLSKLARQVSDYVWNLLGFV